ncbi:MAG: glycosyl hydrolase family 88 [Flavisolibacter sp.]|nr:glycosyl hydrolase family 88 [Flavisolibacter sp.]
MITNGKKGFSLLSLTQIQPFNLTFVLFLIMIYKSFILPLAIAFLFVACTGSKSLQVSQDTSLLQTIDASFKQDAAQYRLLMKDLPPEKFPKNYNPKTAKLETSNSSWWCSGFYPGTLLYLYEETKDQQLYDEAMRIMKVLEKEKNNKGTHDLGFMMYCSFGNAERIAPKPEYKEILLQSARSLSSRFSPAVGAIKSWNGKPDEYLVIIDNMMNLELLFWATRVSGDSSFYKIAVTHANTTMQNHFRPDHSSYHVINYNTQSGAVQQKRTHQGYSDESAWARGQAWGLYGYVVMYRETKDKKYLDKAEAIAAFLLNHPNLPADKIPYWDFNAPNIPSALRDASAGAIMSAALFELCRYAKPSEGKKYFAAAETMLKSLASPQYHSAQGTNGGFLTQHSVGHLPAGTEVDVSISYADYYFVEAMKRYKAFE